MWWQEVENYRFDTMRYALRLAIPRTYGQALPDALVGIRWDMAPNVSERETQPCLRPLRERWADFQKF